MTDHLNNATKASPTTVIIFTSGAKFQLGSIVATPGALRLLQQTGFSAAALLNLHIHGNWGDCCREDADANEFAIVRSLRILNVFRLVDAQKLKSTPPSKRSELPTIWIITESDRSVTTILLPDEY